MKLIQEVLYKPLYNALIFLAFLIPGHSIGWAIVILTIIIRLILLPASLKAARAQAKMQLLQPKMVEIKNKIKDQAEQGKALMELYKKEGVSPLGSCLPVIIQIPIIWVLYSVFSHGLDISNYSSLYNFVPRSESLNSHFLGFDLSKPDLWILPIIAGVTQFILSYITMGKQPKTEKKAGGKDVDPMQMMNKQMVYLFPIMTVFIGRSMPAALVIYWIVTTVFGIAQQLYVNKVTHIEKSDLQLVDQIESEHISLSDKEKPKDQKRDMMTKVLDNKLKKQAKKTGVQITIREKK